MHVLVHGAHRRDVRGVPVRGDGLAAVRSRANRDTACVIYTTCIWCSSHRAVVSLADDAAGRFVPGRLQLKRCRDPSFPALHGCTVAAADIGGTRHAWASGSHNSFTLFD